MTLRLTLICLLFFAASGEAADILRDIRELPQDHLYYLDKAKAPEALVSPEAQRKMDAAYNTLFFSPWHRERPRFGLADVAWEFDKYRQSPGFGENARRRLPSWTEKLLKNAGLDTYPNRGFPAITVDNSDLRVLPTSKPRYSLCDQAGRCSAFDHLQQSGVAVNTPVLATHLSADKAWVLVETGYTYGWLPVRDVAAVDPAFMKLWERDAFVVIVRDKVPLYDGSGRYVSTAPLGLMFPKTGEDEGSWRVLVAVADPEGRAVAREAVVSKEAAVLKPLALTRGNMARVANELVDEPYSWGGMFQNRDCSALVMDLFAPFGLWMPRHSSHQAHETGRYVDLKRLTPREKEQAILREGVPYLTLLWLKGHIMLYIGSYQGKPMVFHSFWSAKTKGPRRLPERQIVGHAAITTLYPGGGLEAKGYPPKGLMDSIQGMTLLIPEGPVPQK